jgi:hypothetical protein
VGLNLELLPMGFAVLFRVITLDAESQVTPAELARVRIG